MLQMLLSIVYMQIFVLLQILNSMQTVNIVLCTNEPQHTHAVL